MKLYSNWHLQIGAKLKSDYFSERLAKVGASKEIKTYLLKMRKHYKGEEVLPELMPSVHKEPIPTTHQDAQQINQEQSFHDNPYFSTNPKQKPSNQPFF